MFPHSQAATRNGRHRRRPRPGVGAGGGRAGGRVCVGRGPRRDERPRRRVEAGLRPRPRTGPGARQDSRARADAAGRRGHAAAALSREVRCRPGDDSSCWRPELHPRHTATRRVRRVLAEVQELLPERSPHALDEVAFEAISEVRAKMRMVDSWLGGSRPPPAEPTLSF